MARSFKLLGHGHPRIIDRLLPHYDRSKIEMVRDFDEVMARANVYVADNSSTLFEFAATGRPVVVLNAPWYRREVHHGLRFWDQAQIGVQCDHPRDLVRATERALEDRAKDRLAREAALQVATPFRDGRAAERAATAIRELLQRRQALPARSLS